MTIYSPTAIQLEHVQQPTAKTCVHACLSMVTGEPVASLINRFGDRGLSVEEEITVLTEYGIFPQAVPFTFSWIVDGVYMLTVPSLNLEGTNHCIIAYADRDEEKFILLDPNEGKEGKKAYGREALYGKDGPMAFSSPYFLQVLPDHKGTNSRLKNYEVRTETGTEEVG